MNQRRKKMELFFVAQLAVGLKPFFFLVVDDVPFDLLLLKGCKGYHGVISSMLCNLYCKSTTSGWWSAN